MIRMEYIKPEIKVVELLLNHRMMAASIETTGLDDSFGGYQGELNEDDEAD